MAISSCRAASRIVVPAGTGDLLPVYGEGDIIMVTSS